MSSKIFDKVPPGNSKEKMSWIQEDFRICLDLELAYSSKVVVVKGYYSGWRSLTIESLRGSVLEPLIFRYYV